MFRIVTQFARQSSSIRHFNQSLDVKTVSRKKSQSPFDKYRKINFNDRNIQRIKTQGSSMNPKVSIHTTSQQSVKKKRRMSLISKNNSLNLQKHLITQKLQKAKVLLCNGLFEQAIPYLKQVRAGLNTGDTQKQIYFWLAIAYNKCDRQESCQSVLSECLEIYPSYDNGLLYYGKTKAKLKKITEAIDILKACISIHPQLSQAYLQLGECYRKAEEPKKALQIWEKGYQRISSSASLPLKIIEYTVQINNKQKCLETLRKMKKLMAKESSDLLYALGLYELQWGKVEDACIYFEEGIKYNSSREPITKSLLKLLEVYIQKNDFYEAYHLINRTKHLSIQNSKINEFNIFLEGVIYIIKKKYQAGIKILTEELKKDCQHKLVQNLINKYIAYAYFKLGDHKKAVHYYELVPHKMLDRVTSYNLLLARGVVEVDSKKNPYKGMRIFEEAAQVYPSKVQPEVYLAATKISMSNKQPNSQKKHDLVYEALLHFQKAQRLNPNSSNLLFHRAIVYLELYNYEEAFNDINRCIQKAQQNLPKYFHLRGLCYATQKDYKKAVNEYSIAVSLAFDHSLGVLERAKCHFLAGNADQGFVDLQRYMEMAPQDYQIHKWIGDLLYQSCSYTDAIKAYQQMQTHFNFKAQVMVAKCQARISSTSILSKALAGLEKYEECNKEQLVIDKACIQLLLSLENTNRTKKNQQSKQIQNCTKKLDSLISKGDHGYVFNLIDLMNLLGVAAFYYGSLDSAYESFLLAEELYHSLQKKNPNELKSDVSEEQLDLCIMDIYLNIFLTRAAMNNQEECFRMLREEMTQCASQNQLASIMKILKSPASQPIKLEANCQEPYNKLRFVEFSLGGVPIKSRPVFHLYHQSNEELYAQATVKKMFTDIQPGYIDNMPQGPWIKRNEYGVIFTQDILLNESSLTFETTNKQTSIQPSESLQQDAQEHKAEAAFSDRHHLLQMLKLDERVQAKINNLGKK